MDAAAPPPWAGREIPPEWALVWEYAQGQRALHAPAPDAETPREQSRRLIRQKKAEQRYCREFLAKLDRAEAAAAPGADLLPLRIARATARLELAEKIDWWADFGAAQELFHQALSDAEATRRTDLIHRAMMSLGHFYRQALWQGDSDECFEAAIWYYKEALVHAHGKPVLGEVPSILYWLGVTYAVREETLVQAVSVFDWASRFGADGFQAMEEKQKCRLRLGERNALLQETKPPADPKPADLAYAIATLQVLGRRKKQVRALAEQGLALAKQPGEQQWQRVFESILKHAA